MNRRNFLRKIVYVASAVAGIAAMNPPTVYDLARKEQDEEILFGKTVPNSSIWEVEARSDGSLHRLTIAQCRRIQQLLASRNVQRHMRVEFMYNMKTDRLVYLARLA